MSNKNDGGPAFPGVQMHDGQSPLKGMTLRDYFAGQALAGLHISFPGASEETIAAWTYRQSDAMLAAREAGK